MRGFSIRLEVSRCFDAWLRRVYGVFEFSQDVDCLLRLQVTRAPHALRLDGPTKILPCIATDKKHVKAVLLELLYSILEQLGTKK